MLHGGVSIMTFTKVNKNDVLRPRYKLEEQFKNFMDLNVQMVKVSFENGEYASYKVAYQVLCTAAKRWKVPVKVKMIDREIYFLRTDI
jgi:hypothetical protein